MRLISLQDKKYAATVYVTRERHFATGLEPHQILRSSTGMTDGPGLASATSLTFLVVVDDEHARFLRQRELSRAFTNVHIVACRSVEHALNASQRIQFNAVIADHNLGGAHASDLIEALRAAGQTCPIVVVTDDEDPRAESDALNAGAVKVFRSTGKDHIAFLRAILEG